MEKERALAQLLLPWYGQHQRLLPWRQDREPYHVWLSEIMLQQTRVEAVKGYYLRFLQELPTLEQLASVDEQRLMKLWEGLGYYNRARNLQKTARLLVEQYGGQFPKTEQELLGLPGIGDYTAGAIASICFGSRTPAVDGNVLRVWSRIMADRRDIGRIETKKQVKAALKTYYPEEGEQCSQFTQSLMELGAMICLPKGEPRCWQCPVQTICQAYALGQQQQLPVKGKKGQRRKEEKTVFLLCCAGRIAVRQRPDKGLLAGLWELPNVEGRLDEQAILNLAVQWELQPEKIKVKIERQHIFTHIQWAMCCYVVNCRRQSPFFYWAEQRELLEQLALPTAFRQFLLEDYLSMDDIGQGADLFDLASDRITGF